MNINRVINGAKTITLLPTARVKIILPDSRKINARALIDSGAETSLISVELVETFGLKRFKSNLSICGVGGVPCKTMGVAKVVIITQTGEIIRFLATIVDKISSCSADNIKNLHELVPMLQDSADPLRSGKIELIIGAEVFPKILHAEDKFHVWHSKLGSLISGPIKARQIKRINYTEVYHGDFVSELEEDIKDDGKIYQDEVCSKLFDKTTKIRKDGRIVVHLPFVSKDFRDLGESRKIALSRLFNLEKTLGKNKEMYQTYSKEILELCATQQASVVSDVGGGKFYLPHHCVTRDSLTTKVRPVFDASVKTKLADGKPGKSLNNYLHVGKKLQTDMQSVLLSFQLHEFAIIADIRKLFLQIEIVEEHKKFLRFLFRESPNHPIKEFQFNRLVFGLSSSPFLAQASLRLSASKEPEVLKLITESFYIDDLLKSFPNLDDGARIINLTIATLNKNKFQMHKFASNSNELLSKIEGFSSSDDIISCIPDDTVGTLGLKWKTSSDTFSYSVRKIAEPAKYTKRTILSMLASIYDPIGWLSCVIVPFRLLYQEVCSTCKEWDTEITDDIKMRWLKLKGELFHLETLEIPRWTLAKPGCQLQLIGSSDASEKCAASLVYLKVLSENSVHIKLLAGKTKISPLGKQITLPKLELLAAEMLVSLIVKIAKALEIEINEENTILFSDSQVVLSWLKDVDIYRRKVYIASRVIRMNNQVPSQCWHYIKSASNSADIPSRGLLCSQLKDCKLYWEGPQWWHERELTFPEEKFSTELELKKEFLQVNTLLEVNEISDIEEITSKYSSYDKLLRITAILLRWKSKGRGLLTVEEINNAELRIVKQIQLKYFKEEIEKVKKGRSLRPELKMLSPYIDKEGILRVLGRLQHFNELSYAQQHPAILPSMFQRLNDKTVKVNFIERYVEKIHKELRHSGPKMVTAHIRTKFWIISVSKAVKNVISNCLTCFYQKPEENIQLMGPIQRKTIEMSSAFVNCIADLAGPFEIKSDNLRSAKTYKSYVILFACKYTKALHLELVSSATSKNFLNALKRFTSRRGICHTLQLDNGTNFKGGYNILEKEFKQLLSSSEEEIANELLKSKITINFIPPYSPHLNGQIERNVKNFKFHLKRVFDYKQTLTYEDFHTLIVEIEGILNSKPLMALSEDPTSFAYLSPAHLCILRPLRPYVELRTTTVGCRDKFDLLKQLSEKFWDSYKNELFAESYKRNKWQKAKENLKINDLVIIKSILEPKRFYKRGRIVEVHEGIDGVVRYATYKLASGKTEKRHIKDLIKLPVEHINDADIQEELNNTFTNDNLSKILSIFSSKRSRNK